MPDKLRRILLVQLPVPPPGSQPMEGNIPLAAAFLKLFARRQGLERYFAIDIFPPHLANSLGDQGLLQAILEREPNVVGFTCYVWNVERSLWLAERIKQARPKVKILLGGPEITADNDWVRENAAVDHAVFGEGEAAFAALLRDFHEQSAVSTAGLSRRVSHSLHVIDRLDAVSSPYREDILEAGASRTMLLETVRGCRFQCKYCYYSKRHAELRYLSPEEIEASLRHAVAQGASEVYLLDPTINQRPDFADFLRFLARCNAERRLTFSGELRAEGIEPATAKLLRAANFTELEIGLQSVEPRAHRLMGRPVNLAAWRQGVEALMAEGIRVRLDLILGLPGDTVESVRRGIDFLAPFRPHAEAQIFNLSILPGTDFRRDAASLGLRYQARPPYYVVQTPALDAAQIYSLMEEAQEALDIEFDAPALPFENRQEVRLTLDLDDPASVLPPACHFGLATTLRMQASDFSQVEEQARQAVAEAVRMNPHSTLQIVLEPTRHPERLRPELLWKIREACYSTTSYLDRYYSLHPGHLWGAKRLFALLPMNARTLLGQAWVAEIGRCAEILWLGDEIPTSELAGFEHVLSNSKPESV